MRNLELMEIDLDDQHLDVDYVSSLYEQINKQLSPPLESIDSANPSDKSAVDLIVSTVVHQQKIDDSVSIVKNSTTQDVSTINTERISIKREALRTIIRSAKTFGSGALMAAGVTLVTFGIPFMYGKSNDYLDENNSKPQEQTFEVQSETTQPALPEPSLAPTTSITTEIMTPTPEPSFDPIIGDSIGQLEFPHFCNYSIDFTAYAESENARQEYGGIIGTGDGVIDQLIPDPSPAGVCQEIEDREVLREANTGINHKSRDELWGNNYKAIGGYPIGSEGYISVRPGMDGVSLLYAHKSTWAAPLADNVLLEAGDPAVFKRSDGQLLNYTVLEVKQLPDNDSSEDVLTIRNYSHPNYESVLAVIGCGDEEGNPGSSEYRTVVYLGLIKHKNNSITNSANM